MHHLHHLVQRGRTTLRRVTTSAKDALKRVWSRHLERIARSPVYEALLVLGVDLVLGHRVDLHEALIRLMARLGRKRPELPDPDGWAY